MLFELNCWIIHVVLESVLLEDRVVTDDEAVWSPTYRRRGVQQIYHLIDDTNQNFPLVEKERKHILLPLQEKLCFWKVFVDDSESIKKHNLQ